MERTGLWDLEVSERYIYAAFKIGSEEGTSRDRKWSRIWIQTCLDAFLPWNVSSEVGILELSDAAWVTGAHGDGKHNKTVHGRDNVWFSQPLNKYSKTRTFKYHNLHFTKTVPGKEHLVQLVMTNSEKHYYSGSSWKMSNTYSWRILQILHLEYKSN